MQEKREKQLQAFGRLLDIMDELREKCPWDRKQTMETLRPLTIEELYELTDAILVDDSQVDHHLYKRLSSSTTCRHLPRQR